MPRGIGGWVDRFINADRSCCRVSSLMHHPAASSWAFLGSAAPSGSPDRNPATDHPGKSAGSGLPLSRGCLLCHGLPPCGDVVREGLCGVLASSESCWEPSDSLGIQGKPLPGDSAIQLLPDGNRRRSPRAARPGPPTADTRPRHSRHARRATHRRLVSWPAHQLQRRDRDDLVVDGIGESIRRRHFSSVLGVAKRDAYAYEAVLDELGGLSPPSCVFVGDGASNELAGAQSIGMSAVRLVTALADPHVDTTGWRGQRVNSPVELLALLCSHR